MTHCLRKPCIVNGGSVASVHLPKTAPKCLLYSMRKPEKIAPTKAFLKRMRSIFRGGRDPHGELDDVFQEFDAEFYRLGKRFADSQRDKELFLHFVISGWIDGLDPNPFFSVHAYLAHNEDVRASGMNPFVHFIKFGRAEGRTAFLSSWQEDIKNPIPVENLDMLMPYFDAVHYKSQVPKLSDLTETALASHYVSVGWRKGLTANASFSDDSYVSGNPDVLAKDICPLLHYALYGRAEGRHPTLAHGHFLQTTSSSSSDQALGTTNCEDKYGLRCVALAEVVALTANLIDLEHYLGQCGKELDSVEEAAVDYHLHGWRCLYNPNRDFDARYYIAQHEYLSTSRLNPLLHYAEIGSRNYSQTKDWRVILERIANGNWVTTSPHSLRWKQEALYGEINLALMNAGCLFLRSSAGGRQKHVSISVWGRTLEMESAVLDGEIWFRVQIPGLRDRDVLELHVQGEGKVSDLFSEHEKQVTLVEDRGHELVVRANSPALFFLFADNEPIREIEILDNPTVVRLPSRYSTGSLHYFEIRDLSGSQIFLSVPVLTRSVLTPQEVLLRETGHPDRRAMDQRAFDRMRSLFSRNVLRCSEQERLSVERALKALESGFVGLTIEPIAFPDVELPLVSVVIPAHNNVNVTYYCLCALLVAKCKASFEVIVVDDGSTDDTRILEELVSGITVLHSQEPQRFIRSCNLGVSHASGGYIVLLNNDTEPTAGWLDEMVQAFERFDSVGVVGSKLLYPDGKLQDAGGIVWASGNPWNYGRGGNPWDPKYCYARQVDYVSGASMMTTRAIWDEVGGLSSYLEPMYFEDTDFSFKVREAGYTSWIVPTSIVYHFEGQTSGTDTTDGFKKFQEINRPKFKRKWADHFSRFGREGQSVDLEKDRGVIGRVLVIDHSTPREDRDAGSYAARREIELIQSLGYKVTFLPQNMAHLGHYTEDLEKSGVETVYAPFCLSIPEFLEARGREFDLVYITRYHVAMDAITYVRQSAPQAKVVLNNADLHFLRELRSAAALNDTSRLVAVDAVRDQELAAMRHADLVLSYNEVEHAIIASHTNGDVRVMACPWVVDIPDAVPALSERHGLAFLGSFRHHPNVEGLKWFCASVMPLLEETGEHLTIYGSGMNDMIRALRSDAIDPVGYVEDVADAYGRHRVFVAPLLSGAGIKGKVLSAMAHGIPTVLTPIAAEGIGLRHSHDCLIAQTPEDWARAIRRLMEDDALWASMSTAARAYAAERFSFAEGRAKMKAIFEAVDLFGAV